MKTLILTDEQERILKEYLEQGSNRIRAVIRRVLDQSCNRLPSNDKRSQGPQQNEEFHLTLTKITG